MVPASPVGPNEDAECFGCDNMDNIPRFRGEGKRVFSGAAAAQSRGWGSQHGQTERPEIGHKVAEHQRQEIPFSDKVEPRPQSKDEG